ncbi:MAG: lipase secretion chaperone [Myxococcota bacterium]
MLRVVLFGLFGVVLGMVGMWGWMLRSGSAPGEPTPPLLEAPPVAVAAPRPAPPEVPALAPAAPAPEAASTLAVDLPDPAGDPDAVSPPLPDPQEHPDWPVRLEDYQRARDVILADDHLNPAGQQAALEVLRGERFSEREAEIVRAIDAGL